MNRLSYIYPLILLSSCGLRQSQTVHENVLTGEWTLERVSCALTESSGLEIERYDMNNSVEMTLRFDGQFIDYSSVGRCTTTSIGKYKTEFDGTSKGVLDFYDVLTGSDTCTEPIFDSGTSLVGEQEIPTTMINKNTQSLSWIYSKDSKSLEMEYFSDFKGSEEQIACSANCYCSAIFYLNESPSLGILDNKDH